MSSGFGEDSLPAAGPSELLCGSMSSARSVESQETGEAVDVEQSIEMRNGGSIESGVMGPWDAPSGPGSDRSLDWYPDCLLSAPIVLRQDVSASAGAWRSSTDAGRVAAQSTLVCGLVICVRSCAYMPRSWGC
ncbi:hypothetical protein BD414DRAFT_493669 [Trametes punicea]|nr:hypothetical protein BD414DRAFT_493669 [Trametes punicea]